MRTVVMLASSALIDFAKAMIVAKCDLITIMNDAGLLRTATTSLLRELGAHAAPGSAL